MSWSDLPDLGPSLSLLERSLERGRLGHAYLFTGESGDALTKVGQELAATVNCQVPPAANELGIPLAACGQCSSCRRIQQGLHPDVHWLRAESKLRIIRVEQIRELLGAIHLKPTEGRYKVGVVVGADRLNQQASNAFLKTLEEPPSQSLLILLSTEPQRLLDTILSRCLRLNFREPEGEAGGSPPWLKAVAERFKAPAPGLMTRYHLLDLFLRHLAELRKEAEREIEERSPRRQFKEADSEMIEQWEVEEKAAVESAYRRRREQALASFQGWLRDVWLCTLNQADALLTYPELAEYSRALATRLEPDQAMNNLQRIETTQRMLHTNVQEALALEVTLLRLTL